MENAPPVQLVSQNLNISLERRDVGAATASPFACPTVNGQETLARVPRAVIGSEDEIGAVMWTSAGDVHGADAVVNMSLVGPATSFTLYTAQTEELEVKDSPEPVMLSLSLSPESKKHAVRDAETLECRYFEEELGEWSTEGCVTVELDGKDNLGCHCGHLSDFIAVKIPTKFEGAITFANLDTVSEITLHCACTSGVRIRVNKGIEPETELTKLPVAIVDGGYSAWNESLPYYNAEVWTFVEVFYSGRPRRNDTITWLATNGTSGRVDMRAGQGTMNLLMDPSGLAETSLLDAYLADLIIEVLDADGETKTINISVTAAVSVMTAAPASVWGHVADGVLCEPVYNALGTPALDYEEAGRSNRSYEILLGDLVRVPFTACDVDAIPVTHRLPRAEVGDLPGDDRQFEPNIKRLGGPTAGDAPELFIKYMASGRYHVLAMVHSGLGEHLLDVSLDGLIISFSLPVRVVCHLGPPSPGSLYPMPSNETCGCNRGFEPNPPDAEEACSPCPAGHFKDARGLDSCNPCPSGSYQSFEGQATCLPCGRGTFTSGSGSEVCEPCGPGTGSEPGSRICDPCPPGTFALGGEPYCPLCRPGTYSDDEGAVSCTRCAVNFYAGEGFTSCRACGMFDKKQITVPTGVGIAGCDLGVMNGTKPGFWAAQELNEESGNWSRVWKCETKGACLGGSKSECREGHEGPLCDNCIDGFYQDDDKLCHVCEAGNEPEGDGHAGRAGFALVCMLFGFTMGCIGNLIFFKSDLIDAWANFFYRVRSNPILFIAQIWAIKNTKKAAARKVSRAAEETKRVSAAAAEESKRVAAESNRLSSAGSPSAAASPPPSPPSPAAGKSPGGGKSNAVVLREAVKANAQSLANMFKEIDEDGDGQVMKSEFRKAIPLIGVKASRAEIDALFDEIDEDKGGFIDPDEFMAFFGVSMDNSAEEEAAERKRVEKQLAMDEEDGMVVEGAPAAAPAAAGGAPAPFVPAAPVVPVKSSAPPPAAPDMLSLSLSLVIVVKFIIFDLTGYLQVNSSMSSSMPGLEWPPAFVAINKFVNGLFNLAFLTEVGSMDCWLGTNYCFRVMCICLTLLSFQMALPVFYNVAQRLHFLAPKGAIWKLPFPRGWKGSTIKEKMFVTQKRLGKLLDRSIHVNMICLMVSHPPLSKMLLGCLECSWFNDLVVLKADKRLDCAAVPQCNGTAGAFLLLYTVGVPTLVGLSLKFYLSPKAKAKFKGTPMLARAKARFGFLCGKYEADFYAYEVLEICRKFLLTGVATLLRGGTYSQLLCKIVITFFFFMLLVRTTPFNSPQLDLLVCTTHFCTLMTLMGALMSKIGFFAAEGVPPEAVGYVMLIIQFFPMFVAFYIVFMAMREMHADKARKAKEALAARRASMKGSMQGLKGSMSNLNSPGSSSRSSKSRLSGMSPMRRMSSGDSKKGLKKGSSTDLVAAPAGEEEPEQTITVKMMRTPLGLGLTVDSQNTVVKIAEDSQAQRSGGFAVGWRLVSLNGQALSAGVSFDKQLSTVGVGTPVIIEVSMPADRV